MFLDELKNFRDTLSERVKSPFIGSFMITWSLIHWKVIAFFLFDDESLSLDRRIFRIESYLKEYSFWHLVLQPALITILVLVSYSLLNSIGLFIKLTYDNWISPVIQKLMNNDKIVEKWKYDKIKEEYSGLKKEFDEEKVKYIEGEGTLRKQSLEYKDYINKSLGFDYTKQLGFFFREDVKWLNEHWYSNGKKGKEYFNIKNNTFILQDGEEIRIDNLRSSLDMKIIIFDKVFSDGRKAINYLIKDNSNSYYGVENDTVVIKYTHTDPKFNLIISNK